MSILESKGLIRPASEVVSQAVRELNQYQNKTFRPILTRHKHLNDNSYGGLIPNMNIVIAGTSGTGKAQPLYSKIYTPNGYTLMGDIKIGDEVCTPTGVAKVSNIFPQGIKECFRVHFSDKTYVDCCGEHLWEVSKAKDRCSKNANRKKLKHVLTTQQLLDEGIFRWDGTKNFKVEAPQPLHFSEKHTQIDPYVLGCIIGDGCTCSLGCVTLTSPDEFIVEETRKRLLQSDLKLNYLSRFCYSIVYKKPGVRNPLKTYLKKTGLNIKSESKFIPKEYLYNTVEKRVDLLQGLMDTDGTVDRRTGQPIFSTSSKQLAIDFRELIATLGGTTTISIKKTYKLDSYTIHVCLPGIAVFKLPRKLKLVKERTKYFPCKYISNIEKIEPTEQQCILVDSDDHLYITDNCTITHNSYCLQEIEEDFLNPILNPGAEDHVLLRCSWEMVIRSLLVRSIRREIPLSIKDIYYKDKTPEQQKIIADIFARESHNNIFYMNVSPTPTQFRAALIDFLRAHKDRKCIMVSIDHIGLIDATGTTTTDAMNQVAHIINELNTCGEFTNVIWMPLMQMNRDIDSRTDVRHLAPRRADVYGTDKIYQNASMFIVLQRPEKSQHELYMQFNPKKYPHLTEYMNKPNARQSNFVTEGLMFWHYLKLREEDETMDAIHIEKLGSHAIKEIDTEHDLKQNGGIESDIRTTAQTYLAEDIGKDDLPF